MNVKVSIIVPIYNCELHLHRCISSLTNQTLKDIEIILVNDGSTDTSGKICDDYAIQDDRIIVIHKSNGGLSDARNVGLSNSNGEYIGFVDADDFVDITMFEKLYLTASENSCDISICDYYRFFNEGHKIASTSITYEGVRSSKEILSKFIGNKLVDFKKSIHLASVCRCLYNKKLLNQVCFSPIQTIEDRLFNIEALCKAENVFYLPKPLYYYFYNSSSICTSYDNSMLESLIYSDSRVIELLKQNGDYSYFNEEIYTTRLIHYKAIIHNEAKIDNKRTLLESMKIISKFKRYVDFDDVMYKKAKINMNLYDKILFGLLRFNLGLFVLIIFKFRKLKGGFLL